jgi:hypothetical protein
LPLKDRCARLLSGSLVQHSLPAFFPGGHGLKRRGLPLSGFFARCGYKARQFLTQLR